MKHYSHRRNRGMNALGARTFIEYLEARNLLSAVAPTVVTTLPDSFNGFTFVSSTDPDGSPRLTVTGMPGDDVMKVSADQSDPNHLKVKFELNGAVLETNAPAYTWMFGPNAILELDGGAGNDLIVDNLSGGLYRSIQLNGGDGNDTLMGSNSDPRFMIHPSDDLTIAFSFSDVLEGGAGDDLLVGGAVTQSIDDGAGNDDIFVGPNTQSAELGDGHNVVHSFTGLPQTEDFTFLFDANGNWIGEKPYYGVSDLPGHMASKFYLSASSSTGSSLLLGRVTDTSGTPGDRAIDPSGLDPLPSSDPSPALLVGDVLWINGTAGNDTASLALDHTGQWLIVDVNGAVAQFKVSDVAAYAFNATGGKDTLQLNNQNGPLPITGWTMHTANPDDTVTVQQVTAPVPGDVTPDPETQAPETQAPAPSIPAQHSDPHHQTKPLRHVHVVASVNTGAHVPAPKHKIHKAVKPPTPKRHNVLKHAAKAQNSALFTLESALKKSPASPAPFE